MGMIRGVFDTTGSMKDIGSRGPRQDPVLAGDRAIPAASEERRDPEIDTGMPFDQAPDSSRSRGYGRYEI